MAKGKRKVRIFYSWQSDFPKKTNLVGADELDRKARLLHQTFSIGTNLITHRLGPARAILEEDLVIPQVSLHRPGMANVRK